MGWIDVVRLALCSVTRHLATNREEIAMDVSVTEVMLGIIILSLVLTGIQLNRIEKQNEGLWNLLISLGADPLRQKN